MEIIFEKAYLRELYEDGKAKNKNTAFKKLSLENIKIQLTN